MRDDDKPEPELAALRDLPQEIEAGRLLEERTVRALRARGLVHVPAGRGRPAWMWPAAAALAIGLFSAGYFAGRSKANDERSPVTGVSPAQSDGAAARPVEVANDTTADSRQAQTHYVVWF